MIAPRQLHAILLCLLPALGLAQVDSTSALSADDYFNKASRQYVKEDKVSALRMLDKGLRAHPGDPRLLKLAQELLKEEQRNQQSQQQQSQQQQQEQPQSQKQEQRPSENREQQQRDPQEDSGLSRRDAERLLDELNREEQGVQERARARMLPARKARIQKDW